MTPHNEARKEDIAKVVLMPGDPLRAKFIAENFMDNYKVVNSVRGMLAYTGEYKGKRITVMGHGMGIPSVGIYSYELFKFYDVDAIIRIGSCGSYKKDVKVLDVLLVDNAYSESTYALVQSGFAGNMTKSSDELNEKIKETAKEMNLDVRFSNIHSSDVFYSDTTNIEELTEKYGCSAVEMESFGLFHNANVLNKKAACILTVSDSLVEKAELTADERRTSMTNMIKLALESTLKM